jgi:hypothetical protein
MISKITMQDVLDFISDQNEVDQKKIYEYAVDCVKESRRKNSVMLSLNFKVGQRVSWTSRKYGKKVFGEIKKLNTKTAIVLQDPGIGIPTGLLAPRWKVDYSFLRAADEKTA